MPLTAVTCALPSKLSALAPPAPVNTLNTTAVSSFVLTESPTMSATAFTVMVTVSTSDTDPSFVVSVSTAAPLKSGVGA